ncbi:MAG TPA: hypothetical protein DCF68_14875, partial [Cyanothece sp. UBA12306]|nr:hypothetical protein [Cyanothece sp. UBA12306]
LEDVAVISEIDHQELVEELSVEEVDNLSLDSLLEESSPEENTPVLENVAVISEIDHQELVEELSVEEVDNLSLDSLEELSLDSLEAKTEVSNADRELLEILENDEEMESQATEISFGAKDDLSSDFVQQQETNQDLDFLEMLPTEAETVAHLEENLSNENKDPFADFFESESETAAADPNDPFAALLDSDLDDSSEELMNLLSSDAKEQSQTNETSNKTKEDEWDNLFDDDIPSTNLSPFH